MPQGSLSPRSARPDLIYVSLVPRKGLCLQFIEVKYRRHLREARGPEVLETVRNQVETLRERWERWYSTSGVSAFRALRRAKLARILRFYADKARRHYLEEDRYQAFVTEINRMIEQGTRGCATHQIRNSKRPRATTKKPLILLNNYPVS